MRPSIPKLLLKKQKFKFYNKLFTAFNYDNFAEKFCKSLQGYWRRNTVRKAKDKTGTKKWNMNLWETRAGAAWSSSVMNTDEPFSFIN